MFYFDIFKCEITSFDKHPPFPEWTETHKTTGIHYRESNRFFFDYLKGLHENFTKFDQESDISKYSDRKKVGKQK